MASEIRVDKINSLSGVGTVTLSPTGVDIAGITTAATLRATTGIVTSLTANTVTSLGAVSGTTGTFTSTVKSGTTATGIIFSVGDSGNSGDRVIQFKRAATTNDINIQAINSGSGGTNLLFNQEGGAASFGGAISATTGTFTGDVDIADKIVHTGDTDTAIRFSGADTITAETGGSERVRINSSGYMGIGENSPANLLHVKVSDTGVSPHGSAQIVLERSGTNHLQFLTAADGTSGLLFGDANDNDVAQIKYDHNVPAMQFITETGERMRIDSTGDVKILDGDLVIGTSGHGIDFSANTENESGAGASTGQILDDYEEGTWTPAYDALDQSSTTFSHNRQYGYYTKIGNLVHVTCYIQGSVNANEGGGSNDNLYITGLPFTPAMLPNSGNIRHAASMAVGSRYRMLVDDLIIHVFGGQDYARLFEHTSGNTMVNVKTNQITPRSGTNETYFAGSFRVHA